MSGGRRSRANRKSYHRFAGALPAPSAPSIWGWGVVIVALGMPNSESILREIDLFLGRIPSGDWPVI